MVRSLTHSAKIQPFTKEGTTITAATASMRRRQRFLSSLIVWVPALATTAALAWAFIRPIGPLEVATFLTMLGLSTGVGISVGYHRLLTHRAFDAPAPVRLFFACAGATAFQGPPIYWSAVHRRHHELSDCHGDPHSPNACMPDEQSTLHGLWHAHIGWLSNHDMPNTLHYVPDLLRDRSVMWVNRHYWPIAIGSLFLPAAVAGAVLECWDGVLAGFLWGGLVRVFVCSHVLWSVNSICHSFGRTDNATNDNSRNVAFLAVPSFGESWHNNHHAFPASARFGHRWWQVDLGYLIIRTLATVGLAFNVRDAGRPGMGLRDAGD